LLSIDGVSAEDLIRQHAKYAVAANDRSTARLATLYLTIRPQSVIPHAVNLPEESVVVVRSADGETKTLRIPRVRTGTPLRSVGPVPSPKGAMQRSSVGMTGYLNADDPAYMLPLRMLSNLRAPKRPDAMVAGFGALTPVHRMPAGFVQRLGRSASDAFFSGTYTAGGKRIGFIRIPHFDPPSQAFAYNQFATEIWRRRLLCGGAHFDADTGEVPGRRIRDSGNELLRADLLRSGRAGESLRCA
jgi:hypothetical protein